MRDQTSKYDNEETMNAREKKTSMRLMYVVADFQDGVEWRLDVSLSY